MKTPVILFIIFLFVMNIFIGSFFWEETNLISLASDETNHISAARSFLEGKNFDLNYIPNVELTTDEIIDNDDVFLGPFKRPITYHVLLGSFFHVFNIEEPDHLFYSAIFNNFLGSIFLIIFFRVLKKYLNLQTAIFTSLIVLTSYYMIWHTLRPLPIGLFFICATAALYFLERKPSNFIIFGFLIGLAHMGAVPGMVLGFSYILFLLFKKHFKGAVLVFLSWNITLIPIYVRNFYIHKDIGVGLYLPFSNTISKFLDFLPSQVSTFNPSNIAQIDTEFNPTVISTEPILQNIIVDIVSFHMDYFLILLGFIVFGSITIYYFVFKKKSPSQINNNSLEYISKIPSFFSVIFLFFLFNALALFYLVINNPGFFPGMKHILLAIFLLTGISIFGIEKIIDKISKNKIFVLKISSIVIILLLSVSVFDSIYGMVYSEDIAKIKKYSLEQFSATQVVNQWVYTNVPRDSTIITNFPNDIKIRTEIKSITIPYDMTCNNLENYINHFSPSYGIWYPNSITQSDQENIFKSIRHSQFSFNEIIDEGGIYLYEIKPYLSTNNLHTLDAKLKLENELQLANDLKSIKQYDDALSKYSAILNVLNSSKETMFFCDGNPLVLITIYEESLVNSIQIYKEQNDFVAYVQNSNILLQFYDNLLFMEFPPFSDDSFREELMLKYSNISQNLIQLYGETNNAVEHANILNNLITYYEKLFSSKINSDISVKLFSKDYPDKLHAYFQLISDYDDTASTDRYYQLIISFYDSAKSNSQLSWDFLMQDYLKTLEDAAQFYKINEYETKAFQTYEKIHELDRTNVKAWIEKAELLEEDGLYDAAIYAYEYALRFSSEESDYISNKIKELKDRL